MCGRVGGVCVCVCNRPSIFLPFFVDFCPRPPTFAADPRVVRLAVGSAPVEHLH